MTAIIILLSVGAVVSLLAAFTIGKCCIYAGWDRGIPLTFFLLLAMALAALSLHLCQRSIPDAAPTINTNFNQLP